MSKRVLTDRVKNKAKELIGDIVSEFNLSGEQIEDILDDTIYYRSLLFDNTILEEDISDDKIEEWVKQNKDRIHGRGFLWHTKNTFPEFKF